MTTTRPNGTPTPGGSEYPQRLFRGKVTQDGIPIVEECLVHDDVGRIDAIAQGWVTDRQTAGNQAQYKRLIHEEQDHRDRQAASRRRDDLLEQALTKLLGSAAGLRESPSVERSGDEPEHLSNVADSKELTVEAPVEQTVPNPQSFVESLETEEQRRAAVKHKLAQVSMELELYPPLRHHSKFWKVSHYSDRGAFEDWIRTGRPPTADDAFRRVLALDSGEYQRRLETWPERRGSSKPRLLNAAAEIRQDACSRLAALIIAAIDTGARRGELLGGQSRGRVSGRGVHPHPGSRAGRPQVEEAAQGADHAAPPGRAGAVADLSHRLAFHAGAYVFGDAIGGRVQSIRKGWDTVVLRAHGMTAGWTATGALTPEARAALRRCDLHFHDWRHEAALRWHEGGLELNAIATLLGHADLGRLRIYLGIAGMMRWRRTGPPSRPSSRRKSLQVCKLKS